MANADRMTHGPFAACAGAPGFGPEPGIGDAIEDDRARTTVVDIALYALIENFEQGVAVVDKAGRAHFLNRAVHALIHAGFLRMEGGCLRGSAPGDRTVLRRAIDDCMATGGGRSTRLVSERGMVLVAACAIPAPAEPVAARTVLLRFTNPAVARLADGDVLRGQFGFTPAEAALAVDILAGHDLAASALRRGITPNTARVHLRRLFDKTGTHRQAELMRLLLLCPCPLAMK
jgi:DNA-binding CsgD family transcriptional regulator